MSEVNVQISNSLGQSWAAGAFLGIFQLKAHHQNVVDIHLPIYTGKAPGFYGP